MYLINPEQKCDRKRVQSHNTLIARMDLLFVGRLTTDKKRMDLLLASKDQEIQDLKRKVEDLKLANENYQDMMLDFTDSAIGSMDVIPANHASYQPEEPGSALYELGNNLVLLAS